MKTVGKWALRVGAGLVGVVILLIAGVWVASELALHRKHERPAVSPTLLEIRADGAALAEGERLSAIYGCTDCHGKDLRGQTFHDDPVLGAFRASNLTRVAAEQTPEVFAAAVVHGVKHDGKGAWLMPSAQFSRLDEADLKTILAYVRSRPAGGEHLGPNTLAPVGRVLVATGKLPSEPDMKKLYAKNPAFDAGPQFAKGRYLAATACAECHGPALKGIPTGLNSPDLDVGAAYEFADFDRFMRTGVSTDGKERGLMTHVAKARFSRFTDAEMRALHGYLVARSERPAV